MVCFKVIFFYKKIEIIKQPFTIMIKRFLVALEESKSSENGVGWTKPFDKSANFKTSIDVVVKLMNSS